MIHNGESYVYPTFSIQYMLYIYIYIRLSVVLFLIFHSDIMTYLQGLPGKNMGPLKTKDVSWPSGISMKGDKNEISVKEIWFGPTIQLITGGTCEDKMILVLPAIFLFIEVLVASDNTFTFASQFSQRGSMRLAMFSRLWFLPKMQWSTSQRSLFLSAFQD